MAAPPSIPPTRVAFCYPGTYRESRRAMGSHLRMASQLEAAGAAVSIFAFVAPPINVTLLHSSWGHRVRQLVNMTAEDTLDEARVISEASRKPFAEKGQLSQWYKMYRLWQLLEAEERRVELEYDVVFKMRFDHDVSLYGTDGTHALRAMLRERDAIWHAGTDYCFMGHRAAMKLLFRAIIDGACSAHRPQNSTLHYGGEVMGRTGYDLDWAKDHILYPVEATRWDSGLAFLQRLVNQSTTIVMSYEGMYVFGGYDGARSLNDLFRFDLATSEWSQVRVTGIPPSPRGGHTAVVYGGTMYAFGGKSGRSPFNDLCGFKFERGTWERVQVQSNAPAPRCAHVCVVYGHSLFVFGGYDGRRYFEDCFELSFQTLTSTHILSLAGDLEPMVDSEHFSDISFLVEGRTIFAHKFILFARCEYFRRMFTSGYKESTCSSITIPDVSYDVFLIVLTFLYTGKPREISLETAVEVMSLANLYGIDPLKRICAEVVTAGLNVQNAAYVLHAADTYQAAQLRAKCLNFMVTNFAQVVRTEAFKELITKESSALVLHFLEEASSRLALSD
eukprot:CAMPEP_0182850974 /NCGR_PEP_ID=MMETSP0006_2-20121128/30381_1 /TAXON_ID=97485 /ORGANISM="Prymnesium parvum, Strain Texoma1" /LENGTH=559 /DNA_ID=CAMNT_0024981617 /DNA_START=42 /DNA_END=1722 /DNA_ORIENTATION=+